MSKKHLLLKWGVGVKLFVKRRWCSHESTGQKSDWLQLRSLLSSKYLRRELKITFSKILLQIGRSVTGPWFFIICFSHFKWTGVIYTFFHSFGKYSFITLLLKRIWRGFEIDVAHNLNMRIEIPSQPWALFWSNERISLIIVSMLMLESLVTVSMVWLLGTELSFLIGLHCSLKKSLVRFSLSKKSVTNALFTRRGGINGTFELLTNVFKIDQ